MAVNISVQLLEKSYELCPAGLVGGENDGLLAQCKEDRLECSSSVNTNNFEGPIRFTRYAAWESQDGGTLRACLAVSETAGKKILPGLYEKNAFPHFKRRSRPVIWCFSSAIRTKNKEMRLRTGLPI